MTTNSSKLLSGRAQVVDYGNLTADRYQFLSLGQAEPNLGPGNANSVLSLSTNNTRVWSNSLTLTSITTTGNISALGNISANYFFGNGSQLTGINGANVNYILNGNSYANITSPNGNLVINTSGPGWTFTTNGNLVFPNNGAIYDSANSLVLVSNNGNYNWTFDNTGNLITQGNISANTYFGNGSLLTGVVASSANANSLTGNTLSNNVINSNLQTVGNLANLTVTGNVTANYYFGDGSQLTNINGSLSGNITFSNTTISTNIIDANINLAPTGNGVVSIASGNGGATGIQLGSNTAGQLVSNALTLTVNTSVTNSIAELNQILGKLVPVAPPAFPGGQTLSITSATTAARMCSGFVQLNNTTTGNKTVPAGTLVNAVRSNAYSTNTITNTGPGDSGTITAYLNSTNAGNVTLNVNATPTGNGTYSNLVITNNEDYHIVNANIASGFWYVFSAQATGVVPSGWNEVYIGDTAAYSTNTPYWYYDASTAPAPAFTSTSFTACASPSLTYSSTIPHYNTGTNFIIQFNVNNLSGNMYPNNGNLLTNTTTAGGAFQAPVSVSYSSANITVPLAQNLYVGSGNVSANTIANITAGFGSSNSGPQVTVTNSYNLTSYTFTPGATVLYKTGTSTAIDESNIVIGSSIGSGSGNAYRIVNPGTGNTPGFSGSEAQFNSQTGPFYSYDATVVGSGSQGLLTFNQTNYASGAYLPAGPNLSGQGSAQWLALIHI